MHFLNSTGSRRWTVKVTLILSGLLALVLIAGCHSGTSASSLGKKADPAVTGEQATHLETSAVDWAQHCMQQGVSAPKGKSLSTVFSCEEQHYPHSLRHLFKCGLKALKQAGVTLAVFLPTTAQDRSKVLAQRKAVGDYLGDCVVNAQPGQSPSTTASPTPATTPSVNEGGTMDGSAPSS